MKIVKKILIISLVLIILLTAGCRNPLEDIKNLIEMGKAMGESFGLIEEERTHEFYKQACNYIKENGLSDNFSMTYEKNLDKSVNVEFNSIYKGVLVEYIYGSDSYGDVILFKEGLALTYSDKTKHIREIESTWDDYSEYFEDFNSIKSALLEIVENIEPDDCAGYESDEGLPYYIEISYNKKDVNRLKVLDFDIESFEFYFSCDEYGKTFDEFTAFVRINNYEGWDIWFGDSPEAAMSYEEMKERFDLHI